MPANETQVGGSHYKTGYEHWDLCVRIPLGYLEGCTTKYVARWRKKHGIEDLKKAMHYLDKLIETTDYCVGHSCPDIAGEVHKFVEANSLTALEEDYIYTISSYYQVRDLAKAKFILHQLIEQAMISVMNIEEINGPGTPEDGGHHARFDK